MPAKLETAPVNGVACVGDIHEIPGSRSKQVRRTRDHASAPSSDASRETQPCHLANEAANGSPTANGHSLLIGAASIDAHGASTAIAATSAAAGTDHDAYADAAQPQKAGKGKSRQKEADASASGETEPIPPGMEALPIDGPAFVDAMHERVDIWEIGRKLMQSNDEKIAQRAWERMLEMKYGKGGGPVFDDVPQIIVDTPSPIRD